MKWERTDLAVGLVVVVAVLILLGALVWKSPALSQRTYSLFTEFERIDGIAQQAPVLLHGYEVGRVGDIVPRVAANGTLAFRVEMKILRRLESGDTLRLPLGTTAQLIPPPVIGMGYIVLEPPATAGAALVEGATIPGSRMPDVLGQVQTLSADLSLELVKTMTTARLLMDSLTRTVGTANQTLATTSVQVTPLLQGVQAELALAQGLTADLRGHLNTLTPATVATIDSVQRLMGDSRRMLGDVNRMLVEREPELTAILASLDSTTALVHNFTREVSDRPWKLFTGVTPPARPTPPAARQAAVPVPGAATDSASPNRASPHCGAPVATAQTAGSTC